VKSTVDPFNQSNDPSSSNPCVKPYPWSPEKAYMGTRTAIFTIILSAFMFGFRPAETPVTLQGAVELNPHTRSAYVNGLTILAKINNQIVEKTATDSNGRFRLTLDHYHGKRLDIFCCGIGIDTLLLYSGSKLDNRTQELKILVPIEPRRNIFGKPYCPICHKTDKVYRVVYGLGQPLQLKVTNGDSTYTRVVRHKLYTGTCMDMLARYYCARDRVSF
jgi:hypothetical protein